MNLLELVGVLVLLLLLKGFFSGSEIALVSSDKIRMRHLARLGNRGAKLLIKMFRNPDRLLTTTLVGTNLATVGFTAIGTLAMVELFGGRGDLYAFLLFTPLLLILGEIVPKSVYQQKAESFAPVIVYPLRLAAFLFFPVIFIFSQVVRVFMRLLGAGKAAQSVFLTREQLRAILEMTERRSPIAAFKRGRIRRAVRFGQTQAVEVMTPLRDLVLFNVKDSTQELLKVARYTGYNPIPIYEENTANVVGVISLTPWDLMKDDLGGASVNGLMVPAYFAAPQQSIGQLLPALRERDDQTAVIVDEYGSAIGILTLEDVLAQVVGEVMLGYHFERPGHRRKRTFQVVEDGVYLLDARLSISDVNDVIGLNLHAGAYRTIGGMFLAQLKHIPRQGEWIVDSGYRFTVTEATEKTVVAVRAEPEI